MAASNLEKDAFFIGLLRSGKLKVSKKGIVTNLKTGRRIGYMTAGYWQISYRDSQTKIIYKMLVHRLVWLAFKGPIPEGVEINHVDEDPSNPSLGNLDPTTSYGNVWYSKNGGSYDAHIPIEQEWVVLVRDGWSCGRIGIKYNLAASSVSRRLKKYKLTKFYGKNETSRKGKMPTDMAAVEAAVRAKGYRHVASQYGVMPMTIWNWFAMAKIEAPRFRAKRSDAGTRRLILSGRGLVL